MELQTNFDMKTLTARKPSKIQFCCIQLEPFGYMMHVFNFLWSATFVGIVFLFVADKYGTIDAMIMNLDGYWYSYLLKIVFGLILIAVTMCLLSMAFVSILQKRAKFLVIYVTLMFVLSIMTVLTVGITWMVRFEGTWFEMSIVLRDRLLIHGIWIAVVVGLCRLFTCLKSAEEQESLGNAISKKLLTYE